MTGTDTSPHRTTETQTARNESTLTELVSGILNDVHTLARQQLDMLKAEIKEDLTRTKRATVLGEIGVMLLTIGGMTLVAFLVAILHEQFHYTLWAICFIIGGMLFVAGVIAGIAARNSFESYNPLPDKTIHALQENLTWHSQPQS